MLVTRDAFRRLCRARDILGDVPDDAPSIRAVATEVDISPFHFIRRFEALFGVTPHQFRIGARLERAKHLLALGDLSVTRICMEVGFSSLGSFSDMFARRVGTSPSAYRRHVRAAVQVPVSIATPAEMGCLCMMSFLPPAAWARRDEADRPAQLPIAQFPRSLESG